MTYLQENRTQGNTILYDNYFALLEEIELIMQAVSMEMVPQFGI